MKVDLFPVVASLHPKLAVTFEVKRSDDQRHICVSRMQASQDEKMTFSC